MNKLREINQQVGILIEGGSMFEEVLEQVMLCDKFPQYNANEKYSNLNVTRS